MYIHLEGMDLAGKSTVCRRLAEQMDAPLVRRNSIADNNATYSAVDGWRRSGTLPDDLLGWFYYAAMRVDFKLYTLPPACAIQDSTILLRSLAYHEARRSNSRLIELFRAALPEHPRFTATFLLKASRERRLERLAKRRQENLSPEDFLIRDEPELFYRMEELLESFACESFAARVIDTTDLEDAEASAHIISTILTDARSARQPTEKHL